MIMSMKMEELTPMTPNCNPYQEDIYHMGYKFGTNVTVMFANHNTSEMKYMIIINTVTGERKKVFI
jgi:hypothetical protein